MAWGCSVEELEERLPQWEWPYWIAFYRLEPFGDDVRDTQLARIAMITAEANRNAQKRPQPFSTREFKLADPHTHETPKANVGDQFKAIFNFLKMQQSNG